MGKLIDSVSGQTLFRKVKFIPKESLVPAIMGMFVKHMPLDYLCEDDPKHATKKKNWMNLYENHVVKSINHMRNYVQGRMKDVAFDYMKHHNRDYLPSVEHIEKLVLRTADLDDTNTQNLAFWWFHTMYGKASSSKYHFPAGMRPFFRISELNSDKSFGDADITPETEAFLLVQYKSCRKKWIKLNVLSKQFPGRNLIPSQQDSEGCEDLTKKAKNKKALYVSEVVHTDLKPLFTMPNAGKFL